MATYCGLVAALVVHFMKPELTVLRIENLTVKDGYTGTSLLDNISFELKMGELVCLTGPSGSGKSTTALALMGLLPRNLRVTNGQVHVASHDILTATPEELATIRGKKIGIVFQDSLSSLNPVLPCGVQVEEPLKLHTGLNAAQRRESVLTIFREMGFDNPERIYRSFPNQLSGGQRQRVMLGMAVILEPQVLIADEPTSALDASSAELILGLISGLKNRLGMSVLLITHDVDLAKQYTTHILGIRAGRMTQAPMLSSEIDSISPDRAKKRTPTAAHKSISLLSVKSLSKMFKRRNLFTGRVDRVAVLDDISLTIDSGEIVGIVGESGVGKTTLGRCIAGLEIPDTGDINLDNQPVTIRRHRTPHPIQVVYQSPFASLSPTMRIGESVQEGLRSRGLTPEMRKEIVISLLDKVGLPATFYTRFPMGMSGGERQRVAIARCLAAKPKLLVADEPTASLDDQSKEQVLSLLQMLVHGSGLSILLISHDIKTVARVCTRVLRLKSGSLQSC